MTQSPAAEQVCLKAVACNAYRRQNHPALSDEGIMQYLPLVNKVVQRVAVYLKPPLSREDLVSAGLVGLVKAARDYNPSHQAEFQTYAYIRIRSAVLDELKRQSFVPAVVNKQIRQAAQLRLDLMEQRGKTPSDEELAGRLEISVDKLYQIFSSARIRQFVSYDQFSDDESGAADRLAGNAPDPSAEVEKTELIDQLAAAISQLDERLRQIIILYYQQDLTMKQIAQVFGLTEPRVSQLHAKALFILSSKMRIWKYDRE